MTYRQWFDAHGSKHGAIMEKLTNLSDDEVIVYFRFENMVKNENDFCPLYAENKKCHDTPELNCYLCACPHFRFNDNALEIVEGRTLYSTCSIDSADGERYIHENAIHQNCSGCLVPHDEGYIAKVFNRDWYTIMKKSPSKAL